MTSKESIILLGPDRSNVTTILKSLVWKPQCPEMISNKVEKTFNKTYLFRIKEFPSEIPNLFFSKS